ncbi:MAG: dihydrodipicolinate synthase family protein [Deltaproteobacteria bacterium]|nr:dihydrodipicolinate synthase family protein [Deltaproteobacteria bacterium]
MALTQPINGIIGACLTPFGEDDRINYEALQREIDFLVGDCDAVSIAAVEAAEYSMLSREERKELLRIATQMVDKRLPVILGCSSPSPREVIELAEYAAAVGGDLIQVLMPLRPWGGQPTIAELMEFFTQVASASPLPIVCYHNPGPGADPPQDAFVKISEINNIRYFKESSRDITKISRLIEQIELAGKGHYFTTMQPLLATLMLGGSGATMPPPGTRIGAQVVRAFRAGNLDSARFWARCFALFPGKWAAYGLPPVMKSAMKHFGIDIGTPSRPYAPVSPRDHNQIGQFLRQVGLLGEAGPNPQALKDAALTLAQEDTFLR